MSLFGKLNKARRKATASKLRQRMHRAETNSRVDCPPQSEFERLYGERTDNALALEADVPLRAAMHGRCRAAREMFLERQAATPNVVHVGKCGTSLVRGRRLHLKLDRHR